ncbi:hypothetical protein B0O99DRAFT_681563 [Bisporella sp. PMI_857]|nr:hypothetical protein B0O99DRAFT_681563 [Bisporella sp. PMI_857]
MYLPPNHLRSTFAGATNNVAESPLSVAPSESQHPRWDPATICTITFGILMLGITAFGIWHQIHGCSYPDGQQPHDQIVGGNSQVATPNELEESVDSVNPRQLGAGYEDTRESNIEIPIQEGGAVYNGTP